MKNSMIRALLGLLAVLSFGCSTMNGARPLDPGQHELGLIIGGPVVNLDGTGIPVPSAVLGAKTGLKKLAGQPLELDYGVNLTGIAFGITQLHLGSSWQVLNQSGAMPALTLTTRFYLASDGGGFWAVNQQEFLFSWLLKNQLIYTGLANYVDFGNVEEHPLRLTPVLGFTFDPFEKGSSRFHLEGRWFAVNKTPEIVAVKWLPADRGAYGVSFGYSYQF